MKSRNPPAILALLWAFAFLSYLLRVNISVAQQYMARELSLTDIQVGSIFTAFLVGYTLFQVPAGILGDKFGPRLVLTISALLCGFMTAMTGLAPGLWLKSISASFSVLLVLRFLLGIGQASTYPVAMNAVSMWFQPSRHALVNSVIFTGSTLGAAFAPPFVASIMNRYGWRFTFYISALLPVLVAWAWWRRSRIKEEQTAARVVSPASGFHGWTTLLLRPAVVTLCTSYLLYCYAISIFVYWLFKYLVDVRHLSIVSGGWAASLPWIAASVIVPILGYISTRASSKLGDFAARRLVAVSCLCVSACLMGVGATARSTGAALFAISICVGLLFSTESSYWSTIIQVAQDKAGAASGLMNLAGNLGGVLSTSLVPVFVVHFGWVYALCSGSVFAAVGAVLWFFIRMSEKTPTLGDAA